MSSDPTIQRQSEQVSTEGEPESKDRRQNLATAQLRLATKEKPERREGKSRRDISGVDMCVCVYVFESLFSSWSTSLTNKQVAHLPHQQAENHSTWAHQGQKTVWKAAPNPLLIRVKVNLPPSDLHTGLRNVDEVFDLLLGKHSSANPSYIRFGKVDFPAITALERKPCSILNSIYMWISITECTEHKGLYQDHKALRGSTGGRLGIPIEMMECILMEG